jgi:hypothetical protein
MHNLRKLYLLTAPFCDKVQFDISSTTGNSPPKDKEGPRWWCWEAKGHYLFGIVRYSLTRCTVHSGPCTYGATCSCFLAAVVEVVVVNRSFAFAQLKEVLSRSALAFVFFRFACVDTCQFSNFLIPGQV